MNQQGLEIEKREPIYETSAVHQKSAPFIDNVLNRRSS